MDITSGVPVLKNAEDTKKLNTVRTPFGQLTGPKSRHHHSNRVTRSSSKNSSSKLRRRRNDDHLPGPSHFSQALQDLDSVQKIENVGSGLNSFLDRCHRVLLSWNQGLSTYKEELNPLWSVFTDSLNEELESVRAEKMEVFEKARREFYTPSFVRLCKENEELTAVRTMLIQRKCDDSNYEAYLQHQLSSLLDDSQSELKSVVSGLKDVCNS